MHRKLRAAYVVPCAGLALTFAALAPTASAVDSGRQTVSSSAKVCVQSHSQFSWYDVVGGFSDHKAFGETFANKPGCVGELYRPAGWLATRLQVFKWDGARWNVCHETGWAYGGGGDIRQGDLTFEQAADQYDFYAPHQPPCGPGYYGTLTSSYVWTGSAWEGTGLWSGNTYAS